MMMMMMMMMMMIVVVKNERLQRFRTQVLLKH
jgi:hypothetical protein